ncbi:MAG TPA: C45 family peptidase [Bacillota bacterium]|nr:C45 family peptidase [Bacillota bacterium]
MKVLNLSGTPHEIGLQHGELAKEEVMYSLDSYEKLFFHDVGITWKEARELAKQHVPAIEKTNIDLIQEMEGIAQGSSMDFEDILTLNARSEIALTQNKSDGCTSLAVLPPTSEQSFLAQTWDWRSAQSRSLIMTKIKQQHAPNIHMVTEGGIIGKIGLNEHGLGVCLNALRANISSNELPIHLGLREVLNSRDIYEAEGKVIDGQLGSSANFLIAQDDEDLRYAVNLELSPTSYDKKETHTSYLYHTNHFCSTDVANNIGKERLNTTENSYNRIDRMGALIQGSTAGNKTVTESVVKGWLSDHENDPNTICRHKQEGTSDYTDTITAFAVIMDLRGRNMYLMEGQPCDPIHEYRFTL